MAQGSAGDSTSEAGQPGALAGVHPAAVNLRGVFLARNIEQSLAIGRPTGGTVILVAGGQRSVVRSIDVQDPQIGPAAVLHDVHECADVNDASTVRRYLRIGGVLQLKDVDELEFLVVQIGGECSAEEGGYDNQ